MRVSDEDIDAVLKIEAITYLVRDTGEVEPEATLTAKMAADLREARAALRAWNMWREKCFDECDGDDAWTEAVTLTKKALEGNDEQS